MSAIPSLFIAVSAFSTAKPTMSVEILSVLKTVALVCDLRLDPHITRKKDVYSENKNKRNEQIMWCGCKSSLFLAVFTNPPTHIARKNADF
jgi:hypothetical protein